MGLSGGDEWNEAFNMTLEQSGNRAIVQPDS
jgi:hypothetical protein